MRQTLSSDEETKQSLHGAAKGHDHGHHAHQLPPLLSPKMFHTGTSAVKSQEIKDPDMMDNFLTGLFQIGGKFLWPNDKAVLAVGHINDLIGDRPMFMPLNKYFREYGGVYKLSFAPVPQATFYVLSDPHAIKHVLKESPNDFDKGLLSEILEPILGKGLIPADPETWRQRRPVIQPGFHMRWLERMTMTFNECASIMIDKLEGEADAGNLVDMEGMFNSVSLDIIGKAVFNYEFGSVTRESPVIKAAYACLKEAEHRSTFLLPYWNVPFLGQGKFSVVPRQREFAAHLEVLNDTLDTIIQKAKSLKNEDDLEALERRDYKSIQDPSLLRFLVDLRGGDCNDKQLRDDLMTLLVAGHETTGSLLTWTAFELAQNPAEMRKVQEEVDRVLGGRNPTMDDIKKLEYTRLVLAEGLRLYPQPPILLRRALKETKLPVAHSGSHEDQASSDMQPSGVSISPGANIFISVWNLHRNPKLWDNPDSFDPSRWLRPQPATNGHSSWAGYTPRKDMGLYPNENDANYGYIPFGGGQRKCVGDQFAMQEAVVILSKLFQRFDIELAGSPEEVGMSTGATIHSKNGLMIRLKKRNV